MKTGGLATFVFTMIAIPVVISVGTGVIATVPSWRKHWLQQHRITFSILAFIAVTTVMALMYCITAFGYFSLQQQQETRKLNPTSQQATPVAGVLFPSGSNLHYSANSDGSSTIIAAESSSPIQVGSLSITSMKNLEYMYSNSFEVGLAGENTIEGLPCKNKAEFKLKPNSSAAPPENWQLLFCELNQLEPYGGMNWPAGSAVAHAENGWVLTALEKLPPDLKREGFALRTSFQMWIDSQQRVQEWSSYLAETTTLGVMQYPAGTEIRWLANGNLIFSPGHQASLNTAQKTETYDNIVQTSRGDLIGIFGNPETAYQTASKPHTQAKH